MTAPRRIDIFFYGLFMDAELLAGKGAHPENPRRGAVIDYALRIGQRATLIAEEGKRAYGVVMALSHQDIDRLYSEESVRAYRPEDVICRLEDGARIAALCFNLIEAPAESEGNPQSAAKLRDLARRLHLPDDYTREIG